VFRFHGGEHIRADVALGILLGEYVVHCWDLAGALNQRYAIEPRDVGIIVRAIEPILPGWVHGGRAAGHTATYELRLRGLAQRHRWRFDDGTFSLRRHDDSGPADCVLSAEPSAALLILYRRRSPWLAALRGRATCWGRRPWLAFSLPDRFEEP
jgi:hypothetical protein